MNERKKLELCGSWARLILGAFCSLIGICIGRCEDEGLALGECCHDFLTTFLIRADNEKLQVFLAGRL